MKKPAAVVVSLSLVVISGCEQLPGLENEAKRAVRQSLFDPDSAKFESVLTNQGSGAVCGFVNAKNRMGAYVGSSPFVYQKGSGVTLVREPPKERDFERYFEMIKYNDASDYLELTDRCKGAAIWEEKCGSAVYVSSNKYCDLVNQGKDMMELYEATKS